MTPYSAVLIGPAGVGTSEIGKELSDLLGAPLIIGDEEFVRVHGSIDNFIKANGRPRFRAAESELIRKICATYSDSPVVFVPGAGAVANNNGGHLINDNRLALLHSGVVFYLLPNINLLFSSRFLAARLEAEANSPTARLNGFRKSAQNLREIEGQLRYRHPLYGVASDHTIYTEGKEQAQVAVEMLSILSTYSAKVPAGQKQLNL